MIPPMSEPPGTFADWACDPRRGLEERFGAEILIESTRSLWNRKHNIQEPLDFEARMLRAKQRSLDPAYEPRFTREQALRAQEVLPELKEIHADHLDDRPLRDISFLRFCPAIECVHTSQSEITDWSPLRFLPCLTRLHVFDKVARDFTVLGEVPGLESVNLWLRKPWPDLSGMERLTRLRNFEFSGNILALQVIPRLDALLSAKFTHGQGHSVPVRRVADLPAMPELRRLHLDNAADLDGIERLTHLVNLSIHGCYTDLTPLAALENLTHLFLSGGDYPTLSPISRMPALRKITLCLELPPDLTPLADLPLLHEIAIEQSPIVPAELASLNSLCNPWDEEFTASPARTRQPLRLLLHGDDKTGDEADSTALPRAWGEDQEMANSEARWFTRKVNRLLDRLLGKGWGHANERYARQPGHHHITITRGTDIDRLPKIVRALRKALLEARHPWSILLIVDSLAHYERDMDDIRGLDGDDEEFNAEREREEWEYARQKRRERREFLERKYRLLLSRETGIPIPPQDPEAPRKGSDGDDLDQADEEGDEDDFEPEYDLGTRLHLYATLTERAIYINEQDRGLAEMLFEMKLG
jgi:hypothetical protein